MTKVLTIGFAAEAADLSEIHTDRETLRKMIADSADTLRAAGYDIVEVMIGLDQAKGVEAVREALRNDTFDVVLIGNGVRGVPGNTELFEALVNTAHGLAHQARFAFNASPVDSIDAVRRNS